MIGRVSGRWSSTTTTASVAEGSEDTSSSSSSAPPAVDADAKSYGAVQEDAHKVATGTHNEDDKHGEIQESISDVGYDMSKVTKPSGSE